MLWIKYRSGWEFDWGLAGHTIAGADWAWLGAACVLNVGTYWGRTIRWAVMIRPLRPQPSHAAIFQATLIGFTALVLIGRPGEFIRPYLIAVKEKVPVTSQLAAWGLERIFDILAVLAIFGIGLSQVNRSAATVGPTLEWVLQVGGMFVAAVSLMCLTLLILIRSYSEWARRRIGEALSFLAEHHLARVQKLVGSFLDGMESIRTPGALAALVGYTVFEWVLIVGCFFCTMKAFPGIGDFGWMDILILVGFVAFGAVVQLPGIGGGMQAVAALILHELFAVPVERALAVAMVIWAVNFLVIVPIGLPLALREGLNWGRLREISREAEEAGA
ncbi:MAG: flippase-like domain-containing protein [Bryobacterales bacterium]|nr:flippase-like domain-containing protein [Bryobacterales bacterium]